MKKITWLISALALAGCAAAPSPPPPGPAPPAAVPQAARPALPSHITFLGENPVRRRQFADLDDRIAETVTLKSGAVIVYLKLKQGGFPGNYSDSDALRVYMGNPFLKQRDIRFARKKVKRNGPFTYIVQSSPSYNCFAFFHAFGAGGKRGDQSLRGQICYFVTGKDTTTLERDMLAVLDRMQLDGQAVPAK